MDMYFMYLCSLVFGFWIYKKLKEMRELPPGPWGLPILGYLPYLDRRYPHLTLTDLSKKYGSIYALKMGTLYTVVLTDNKLIRECFAKEEFSGRAPLYLTHGIMHGNGIICAEGALWKDQRKLVTNWLKCFGMSKHGMSRAKLENRIANGVNFLLESIKGNQSMDLSQLLSDSLGNVINEIIFGFKFPSEDKTWHWLRQIQEEGCHEMGVAGVVNFLPFLRFFSSDIRKTIEVIKRGQAQTHRLYASIIARRRKILGLERPSGATYHLHDKLSNSNLRGQIKCIKYSKHTLTTEEHYFDPETLIPTDGDSILDSFLYEQKKRFEEGDASSWTMKDEQLIFLLADMFGAGLDTTSVTLGWFLLYMALYPNEQEQVRNEIITVHPTEDDADGSKLPRLMAAVCETQRIRSIVPVGIPHGCLKESVIKNFRIPKGTMVVPLQWALHMNSDTWENPNEFRPSRFIADDGSLLKPQEFIPFQSGKRMCPGDELSRMLVCGFTTRLLRRWRLSLACDIPTEEDMLGSVGVTLNPPPVRYYCRSVV